VKTLKHGIREKLARRETAKSIPTKFRKSFLREEHSRQMLLKEEDASRSSKIMSLIA